MRSNRSGGLVINRLYSSLLFNAQRFAFTTQRPVFPAQFSGKAEQRIQRAEHGKEKSCVQEVKKS